jgi:hypothetical protein
MSSESIGSKRNPRDDVWYGNTPYGKSVPQETAKNSALINALAKTLLGQGFDMEAETKRLREEVDEHRREFRKRMDEAMRRERRP